MELTVDEEQQEAEFKTKLKDYSKEFIVNSIKLCSKNKDALIIDEQTYPEQKSGMFYRFIEKSITNYDYFIEKTISDELEELTDFQSLNLILSEQPIKEYYQNFYKQKGQKPPSDVQELTKTLPKKFLISYLKSQNAFTFNEKIFKQTFKKFYMFLKNYTSDEYVMPLYNFKSNAKDNSLKFGTITLRAISDYELKVISDLKPGKISPIDRELTHVISAMIPSDDFSSGFKKATSEFQIFLDSLTLNFVGGLQNATIFQNINYDWKSYEIGDQIKNYLVKNKLNFLKENYSSLKNFHNTLSKSNVDEKENLFVRMSIGRFRTGINRTSLEDKIIDFITSLESLYSTGAGDLTRKLSQRASMIVAKVEEEREFFCNFLAEAYHFRSGLVHGEGKRDVTVDGKNISIEEICSKLEDITRESIKKYLKLIKYYDGQRKNKKIIDEIDDSIINRKKYSVLKKKF